MPSLFDGVGLFYQKIFSGATYDMILHMLTFQEIHAYNKIAKEGKAKPLLCPLNNEHGDLIPSWGEDEFVHLMCLSCNTKVKPGYQMTLNIKKVLY